MLKRLDANCHEPHRHEHLTGGEAATAAFYPVALMEAVLRGIQSTADAEAQALEEDNNKPLIHAVVRAGSLHEL